MYFEEKQPLSECVFPWEQKGLYAFGKYYCRIPLFGPKNSMPTVETPRGETGWDNYSITLGCSITLMGISSSPSHAAHGKGSQSWRSWHGRRPGQAHKRRRDEAGKGKRRGDEDEKGKGRGELYRLVCERLPGSPVAERQPWEMQGWN